jgi:hypothetical protein
MSRVGKILKSLGSFLDGDAPLQERSPKAVEAQNIVKDFASRQAKKVSWETSVEKEKKPLNAVQICHMKAEEEREYLQDVFKKKKGNNLILFVNFFVDKDGKRLFKNEALAQSSFIKSSLERSLEFMEGAVLTLCALAEATGPTEQGKEYRRTIQDMLDELAKLRKEYECMLQGDTFLESMEQNWKIFLSRATTGWGHAERIGDTSILGGGTARQNAAEGEPLPIPVSQIRRPNKP